MAKFNIDIARQNAVMQKPMFLPTADMQKALRNEFGYGNLKVLQASEVQDKVTATGNPVFMPVEFGAIQYEDESGGTVDLTGLYIPCAIVEFTMNKHIVTTQLASSKFKGDVNELVGLGNWDVEIKGMLVGDGKYPKEDLQKLYYYFKCPRAISITHEICEKLEIYDIVLAKPALQNKQGFQHLQPFTISCISDEPVELTLK
ncbi:MAG TPA: DUF6046 domain-containing protein [Chitinophagales bacterium]|nr:DUF6046 domain-containing protein [Chitinophagales bacterium]